MLNIVKDCQLRTETFHYYKCYCSQCHHISLPLIDSHVGLGFPFEHTDYKLLKRRTKKIRMRFGLELSMQYHPKFLMASNAGD